MAFTSCQKIVFGIILILTILLAGLIFASKVYSMQPQQKAIIITKKMLISGIEMILDIAIYTQDYYNKTQDLLSTTRPLP